MASSKGTPHNHFFIRQFSDLNFARSFFEQYLPEGVRRLIDWKSLRLLPGDFVQKALLNRRSDLLYEVRVSEQTALLYLHLEHQQTSDPRMPYRILIYQANIWQQYERQRPDQPLPWIYPLVCIRERIAGAPR